MNDPLSAPAWGGIRHGGRGESWRNAFLIVFEESGIE